MFLFSEQLKVNYKWICISNYSALTNNFNNVFKIYCITLKIRIVYFKLNTC